MDFAEIAFQNVVGFPATGRLPLAAGLNAFVSPETDLFLLLHCLFGSPAEDISALRGPGTPRKLALTIHGDDGQSYRLVRDLDAGLLLLRADPVTKKPTKMSDDPEEIARVLLDVAGLPDILLLRQHFWLCQADLPSRAPPLTAPGASVVHQLLGVNAPPPENVNMAPEEARLKLPEFKAELVKAHQFEQAQDTLYGLQQRFSELTKAIAPILEAEQQVAELTAKGDAYRRFNEITGAVEARIKKYPEIVARRDGALQEAQKKRAEYERALAYADATALVKDPIVLGGSLGGLVCLLVAYLMYRQFPGLWAMDIIPFGVAAFGAWRWVDRIEASERERRRLGDLADIEKRIHKQYEVEIVPIQQAMKALGAYGPEEVVAKLEERDMVDARRVAATRELEQKRSDPRFVAVENERLQVEQELRAAEAIVQTTGFTRDTGSIQRDIKTCEQLLSAKVVDTDALWAAVEAAGRYAQGDPRALLDSMRERLSQYLVALTDRRFSGVRLAGPGVCHVVGTNGGACPLSGLPPADQDIVYIALRLALVEKVAAHARRPVFIDEPSVLVDAAHRILFVKMLKTLGGMTQVVVRAFDAPPAGVVDHIARVGQGP